MPSGTTTVGSVKYDAGIDLAQLKKSLSEADKLVKQSYDNQSKAAKKAAKTSSSASSSPTYGGTGATEAQMRLNNIKRQAEETAQSLSKYTPQIQRQFLSVERSNNQVASASERSLLAIQKYGIGSYQATNATNSLNVAVQNQVQAQSRLRSSLDQTSVKTYSFDKSTESVSKGLVAMKAAAIAAGAAIAANIGNATSRFDTLNNAPKVLQNLGNSAEQSNKALAVLDAGIRGLPTSLDSAVSALTKISAASNLSADSASILTLAFNNMALAGGKGAVEAERALVQFTQALGKGTLPAQEFNTLMDVMPAQMQQVAQTMLGASANAYTLRDAMNEGAVDMGDFSAAIIRLNVEGGNGFASFANQAKDATAGVATGWSNLQISITRGITSIMESIGGSNIQTAMETIGESFERALNTVARMINFVSSNWNVFGPLVQVIATLGGTIIATTASIRAFAAVSAASSAAFGTLRLLFVGNSVAAAAATRGNYALATSLLAARAASIRAVASFTIVGTVMAAIGFAVGEILGGMNDVADETADAASSSEDIERAMRDAEKNIGGSADNAGDLAKKMEDAAKQIAKINQQMKEVREDYRYSLAQLVKEKNQNIATLTKTLTEEERAYKNAYNERLTSFNKSQNEELLTHQQKTRALQNQIDFLSKYNTVANQKQVTELQFALARENAEYQKSTTLKKKEFDTQTQSAKTEYEKRRAENEKKLGEELKLLEKHKGEVKKVRGVMLLDEIEMLKKQRDEQLKSLKQQKEDIISQLTQATSQSASAAGQAGSRAGSIFKTNLIKSAEISRKEAERIYDGLKPSDKVYKQTYKDGKTGKNIEIYVPGFADGGFTGLGGKNDIRGVVHAGEYVLPKEQVDQATGQPKQGALGGGVNVVVNLSMSGVMTSSKSDERAIATRIGKLINETVKAKTGSAAIAGL